MSNFICSECGMTNIDCGGDGYKTPKEIELENQIADLSKKVHILNEANMKLENELGQFADLSKTIEHLQEQLKEANEVIKKYSEFNNWEGDDKDQHDMTHFVGEDIGCGWSLATDYLEKWGVK